MKNSIQTIKILGAYSSRLWTAILAITVLFLQCRSLCFTLRLWPVFLGVGYGVPILVTSALLFFDPSSSSEEKRNPSFQYGNAQAAISVFILVMCFIVIIGCLILHQRYKKIQEKYLTLSREVASSDSGKLFIQILFYPRAGPRYSWTVATIYITFNLNFADASANALTCTSTSNLIISENVSANRHDRDTESSDDEMAEPVQNGNSCGNSNSCCSVSSPIKTIVDIEDIVQRNIEQNIEE